VSDNTELYYSELEYERNKAEDAYFAARPQIIRTSDKEALFRAGFDRAFNLLWKKSPPTE
jgi:hypothetical protein